MITCPKCHRQVQPKRLCIYCGEVLSSTPVSVQGRDAMGWLQEGLHAEQGMQHDKAIQCFDNALKIDGKHALAWGAKARAHAARGERDEAVRCLNEALAIDPNDGTNKSLRARLAQMPQGLPPGRPATASVSNATGWQEREYAALAGAQLYGDLELVKGPSEILATNWMCAVPPHHGWPGAPREVVANVYTKDGRAFAFYFTPDVKSVPTTRVTDEDLAGWGALLQGGRASAVYLGANVVWSPTARHRIDVVNERLERLAARPEARIHLIVVAG